AIVHFTNSILLDEFDLAVPQVVELELCRENDCKVFVSAPKSSFSTLDNIHIGDRFTKLKIPHIFPVCRNKYHKAFGRIQKGLEISNANDNYACGPVAVYIVSEQADFYDNALCYEPNSPSTSVKWTGSIPLTVLSAQPFRIAGDVRSGALQGSAFTTGFDNVRENSSKCPSVSDFRSTESFSYYFNGPIATLYSESEAEVELAIGSFQDFSLETPRFVSSPGYIGCQNGETYRSSLYPKKSTFHLIHKK
ncbi:hypothetical protein PENTCL1PPCAC_20179, partial [Pristionchus entomophagus]